MRLVTPVLFLMALAAAAAAEPYHNDTPRFSVDFPTLPERHQDGPHGTVALIGKGDGAFTGVFFAKLPGENPTDVVDAGMTGFVTSAGMTAVGKITAWKLRGAREARKLRFTGVREGKTLVGEVRGCLIGSWLLSWSIAAPKGDTFAADGPGGRAFLDSMTLR